MTKIICDKCEGEKSVAQIHIDNITYLTTKAIRRGKTIDEAEGPRRGRNNTFHGRPAKYELCLDCRVQLAKMIMDFVEKQPALFAAGANGSAEEQSAHTH